MSHGNSPGSKMLLHKRQWNPHAQGHSVLSSSFVTSTQVTIPNLGIIHLPSGASYLIHIEGTKGTECVKRVSLQDH